jgi:hypothetical protein
MAVLILDVDGVMSPIAGGHMGPLPTVWPTWERAAHVRMPVFFSPDLVARLSALPVERVWCSTWQDMVDIGLSRSLGWEGQTSLRFPWDTRDQKLGAVQDYLVDHPDRPFIWVDDDPEVMKVGRRWARGVAAPHLLMRPAKTVGLTPTHVRTIERWCRALVDGTVGNMG